MYLGLLTLQSTDVSTAVYALTLINSAFCLEGAFVWTVVFLNKISCSLVEIYLLSLHKSSFGRKIASTQSDLAGLFISALHVVPKNLTL